jgi:SAM-dependent methyltransferase
MSSGVTFVPEDLHFRRLAYAVYRVKPGLFVQKLRLGKLLVGGLNRRSAATHARLTGDLRRPSTAIADSAYVQFLKTYRQIGDAIFQPDQFAATSYVSQALQGVELYGRYCSHVDADGITQKARRFARMLDGEYLSAHDKHESRAGAAEVRRIKFSDCYEVVDGHHRLALAVMRGLDKYPCSILPTEGALTPLQQLVMDSVWMFGKRRLCQPISAPELQGWPVERRCVDRLEMITAWLARRGISSGSFLDLGSSYGWFISEMSKRGFQALGIERDAAVATVGQLAYGIEQSANTVLDACTFLPSFRRQYDVVCCLSILHHFLLGDESIPAAEFIKFVDSITKSVLFLDTEECPEGRVDHPLNGWNSQFILTWLRDHTSFSSIEILGVDRDRHGRRLFVCSRAA